MKSEKEGKIAIPTKVLSSFVNFLPNKPVNLELKDLTLKVECDNHRLDGGTIGLHKEAYHKIGPCL